MKQLLAAGPADVFGTIGRPTQFTAGPLQAGGEAGINFIIDNVVSIFFAAGTIAFVLMFVWGAVQMILSGGDKEAIAKARARITWAIVGVALLALSYLIFALLQYITGFTFLLSGPNS